MILLSSKILFSSAPPLAGDTENPLRHFRRQTIRIALFQTYFLYIFALLTE